MTDDERLVAEWIGKAIHVCMSRMLGIDQVHREETRDERRARRYLLTLFHGIADSPDQIDEILVGAALPHRPSILSYKNFLALAQDLLAK